MRQLAKNK